METDDEQVIEFEIDYEPRKQFLGFHDRTERWAVMVCHRRAGKTVACINDLVRAAFLCDKDDGRFAYVGPTYANAKDVAWGYLKKYAGDVPGAKFNETELRVDFEHNGARVRLYGADNAHQRLRGIYLDGVILDEAAQMPPSLYGEVIRPMLADRHGWAAWIGTPEGRNMFYRIWRTGDESPEWFALMLKASESGILPDSELQAAREQMSGDQYAQEMECSFDAAIQGAYYARLIEKLRADGKVTGVPYDPILPVYTAWDLGVADHTAIVFWQSAPGGEIRIIDYYEAGGHGLEHYVSMLRERGYNYGDHFAPHDIEVRELGTGRSRLETARSLGINFHTLPNLRIQEGINAARTMLPRCWIDSKRCENLIECLTMYREKRDDKRDIGLGPLHDWASHGADAVRYMALALDRAAPASGFRRIDYDNRGIV